MESSQFMLHLLLFFLEGVTHVFSESAGADFQYLSVVDDFFVAFLFSSVSHPCFVVFLFGVLLATLRAVDLISDVGLEAFATVFAGFESSCDYCFVGEAYYFSFVYLEYCLHECFTLPCCIVRVGSCGRWVRHLVYLYFLSSQHSE